MSARSGPRTRPLGSVRQTAHPKSSHTAVPVYSIPPHPTAQSLRSGVQGSAMTLPTPRPTSHADRRKSMPLSSRDSSCSTPPVSHEACEKEKNMILAREAQLKEQIQKLQKEIARLTAVVGKKDGAIHTLTSENDTLKANHAEELKAEREKQTAKQQELDAALARLHDLEEQLRSQEQRNKTMMQQLQKEMEDLIAAKNKEIEERDQALSRLKAQLADSMKGGSLERQQQLIELGKELMTLKKESDMLRNSLKTLTAQQSKRECSKCAESANRAERLAVTLKERDVTIGQLKTMCGKFETQLKQQDVLLKQYVDNKR